MPRLEASLSGEPVGRYCQGPFAVAWTGADDGPDACSERTLALLDGYLVKPASAGAPETAAREELAAAFERHAEGALDDLHGEFAIALWDPRAQRGVLARDPLGARSLFVWTDGARLMFASELRTILKLLERRPSPDEVALVHWLARGTQPGAQTLYQGIRRLEPGHLLALKDGGSEKRRYWSLQYRQPDETSTSALADRVRRALTQAVSRSTEGHANVGILLSGGLDSASVASVAQRVAAPRRQTLTAYSAVFPDHPQADESSLIDALVTHLKVPAVRAEVRGGSALAGALEFQREWEAPLPSPNHYFWQPILRNARHGGATLMIDGEGGDQLFGCSPYLLADLLRHGRLGSAFVMARRLPGVGDHPTLVRRALARYGLRGAVPVGLHRIARRGRKSSRTHAPAWLTSSSATLLFETDDPWQWKASAAPRWWAFLADLLTRQAEELGIREYFRRRGRMVGLESRHPLGDMELIEEMLTAPPHLSFDPHLSRPVLRASVRGLVPDRVRLRSEKSVFNAVSAESLRCTDWQLACDLLVRRDAHVNAFVSREYVRERLFGGPPPDAGPGAARWAAQVWRLATTECWLRQQADTGFADAQLSRLAPDRPPATEAAAKAPIAHAPRCCRSPD